MLNKKIINLRKDKMNLNNFKQTSESRNERILTNRQRKLQKNQKEKKKFIVSCPKVKRSILSLPDAYHEKDFRLF